MKNYKYFRSVFYSVFFSALVLAGTSCKKYLDAKPQQNLAEPSSLKDLRAVLDNASIINTGVDVAVFSSDDMYMNASNVNSLSTELYRLYTWDKNALPQFAVTGWNSPYQGIYYTNFVLDNLSKVGYTVSEQAEYNSIKGCALFSRAFMFHQLAQVYCKPYDAANLQAPGIVLKIESGVTEKNPRSTVEATYAQIIGDLKTAAELLPETQKVNSRSNTAAAYGMLARVYLSMRDYVNAELYADKSLGLNSSLMDYNNFGASPTIPNYQNNIEISYYAEATLAGIFSTSQKTLVDTLLYRSYAANDIRKTAFYNVNGTGNSWRGTYANYGSDFNTFCGIATDEIYLIRSECRARNGKVATALDDLNTLLRKRWKTGTFTDVTAANQSDAVDKILTERRKELAFRTLRWSDLRRFNLDGASITLTRFGNGNTYTLPPNDLRWVLLIPQFEVERGNLEQNAR